jgi:hypothetical protein
MVTTARLGDGERDGCTESGDSSGIADDTVDLVSESLSELAGETDAESPIALRTLRWNAR